MKFFFNSNTFWRAFVYFIFSFYMISLSSCNSPYSAQEIPKIDGVTARMTSKDQGEVSIDPEFPNDCEARRDAILLTSADLALKYNFDHFEYSDGDRSRLRFLADCKKYNNKIIVFLCRGNCPTMYSADSVAHVLVQKFARSVFSEPRYRMLRSKYLTVE